MTTVLDRSLSLVRARTLVVPLKVLRQPIKSTELEVKKLMGIQT